jgi:membrane-associated phospholipid phosphatase
LPSRSLLPPTDALGGVARRSSSLVLVAALVGPLLLFVGLATQVTHGRAPGWDGSLMRLLRELGTPPVPTGTQRMVDNSTVAGAVVVAGLVLVLAVWKRIADALFVAAAVAGVVLVEPLLKHAFERQPPGGAEGFSFPSGSAMASMSIVAAVAVLAWPTRARWPVVLVGAGFVVAFGVAIVVLRWHYPSDVLAGWCVALMWVSTLSLFGRGSRPILGSESTKEGVSS